MPILFIVIFKCFVHDKAVSVDLQKQLFQVVLSFFLFLSRQIFYSTFSHLSPIRQHLKSEKVKFIHPRKKCQENLSPGDPLSWVSLLLGGMDYLTHHQTLFLITGAPCLGQCNAGSKGKVQPSSTGQAAWILRNLQGWGQFHPLSAMLQGREQLCYYERDDVGSCESTAEGRALTATEAWSI